MLVIQREMNNEFSIISSYSTENNIKGYDVNEVYETMFQSKKS